MLAAVGYEKIIERIAMLKKLLLVLILTILTVSALTASAYSLVLPERKTDPVLIMDESGDEILLDEYVFYKRWNGLFLEYYDMEHAYTITDENGSVVVIFTSLSDAFDVDMFIRRLSRDISTIIYLNSTPDADSLTRYLKNIDVICTQRIPERERLLLERRGLKVVETELNSVINIENGKADVEGSDAIVVRCPHCNETFTLYI